MSLGNGRAEARVMSPQTPHSSHCATAPQSKHQLPHNQNTNCPTIKTPTAPQSKHQLPHNQNTNCPTIKTPAAPQPKYQTFEKKMGNTTEM